MSVVTQVSTDAEPASAVGSIGGAELIGLLDRAARLAGAAGRPELSERLGGARAQLIGRGLRVVLAGAPGQGVSRLAGVLAHSAPRRLPEASFVEIAGPVSESGPADVVLFVAEAGHEYTALELDALTRIRAQGAVVVGVLSKIDVFPQWAEVQKANRRCLRAADLDSPPIPLLPVSALFHEGARQRGDEPASVASGVPQLVDFLSERVKTHPDPAVCEAVLAAVRSVTEELSRLWNGELTGLRSEANSPARRQQRAVAELERRQALSVNWQLGLGDGATELMAQLDFDLRARLRQVGQLAEVEIAKTNPVKRWLQFDAVVRGQVREAVTGTFCLARERSRRLAEQVAGQLAGAPVGSSPAVALPDLRVNTPDEALHQLKPMPPCDSANRSVLARVVNSVRGSYGGILMVGVLTSLVGMVLINVWSVAAGVLLGVFTFYEDRKSSAERAKAEAKVAVSKLLDEANFRAGDELRTQLRAVHRTMRDHFTVLNDQRLRAAADAVRASADTGERENRLLELRNNVAELGQLQARLAAASR